MAAKRKTPTETDPRPLHVKVAADLRAGIMAGEYPPGSKLPSISTLKKRFAQEETDPATGQPVLREASSQTVVNGISILKDEHLAVGQAGRGVIVRPHRQRTITPAETLAPSAEGERYRWLDVLARDGGTATSTLLDVAEVPAPADVRTVFGLDDDAVVVERTLLFSVDDEPVELVRNYYPTDIARGTALAERRRIKGGTPTLLTEMGLPPRTADDFVTARIPTTDEYQALRLPTELPILRILRVVTTDDDRPIEVSITAKAGHLNEMHYRIPIT